MKIVADRSAPHDDGRHRRPASGHRAGWRRRAVHRPARPPRRKRAIDQHYVADAHQRLRRGARRRAARSTCERSPDRPACRPMQRCAVLSRCSPTTEKVVTVLQPGRQPVLVGHRQGQRHHQLPSRDRPHRPAGHGAVLGHRPAQRHGRPRGRRACQHARRAYGDRERRRIATACSASGSAPTIAAKPGPEGRRHVPRRRRRTHQGAVDHGDQSGRSRCRMPMRSRRRSPPVPSSSSPTSEATPTPRVTPMCCCPRSAGARRTAPSPIPSGASRGSAPSSTRPARRGPTGGSWPRSARAWGLRRPSLMIRRPISSPSMPRFRLRE